MPKPKYVPPDEPVGLQLTAAERNLLCEDVTFLDDEYVDAIQQTPAGQPVKLTLSDWDDLGGYVAAEANHTEDKKSGERLDALFDKIQTLLDTYTNEEPPKTVKIAGARKGEKPSKRAVQVAERVGASISCKPTENKVKKPKARTSSATLFQFKITLQDIEPPIWRRIQVKDCTLDKLHEHVQTAMGWTNSHLHQFEIGGVRYGDPELIYEGWEDEEPPVDSRRLKISKIVPASGKRFSFDYEYDFGDGWQHEILFEGCLQAEKGTRYPLCLEGERACPPEDVGGSYGYQEYLEALADPKHERHKEFMEWSGRFNADKFDAKAATTEMQVGLPDWREME